MILPPHWAPTSDISIFEYPQESVRERSSCVELVFHFNLKPTARQGPSTPFKQCQQLRFRMRKSTHMGQHLGHSRLHDPFTVESFGIVGSEIVVVYTGCIFADSPLGPLVLEELCLVHLEHTRDGESRHRRIQSTAPPSSFIAPSLHIRGNLSLVTRIIGRAVHVNPVTLVVAVEIWKHTSSSPMRASESQLSSQVLKRNHKTKEPNGTTSEP